MDRQQSALALLVLLLAAALVVPSTGARRLRGDAVSTAVSTGGTASSTSASQGDASVHTTTVAAQGGEAVVSQGATYGHHEVTKVAVGNTTATVERHDPAPAVTWEDAPDCPFSPTAANSVKDNSGRLWGWHQHKSCAFKLPAYHVSWDAAPACPETLDRATAVQDLSGREWGWHNNASCAFKPAARKLLADVSAEDDGVLTTSSTSPINSDAPADSQDSLTTVEMKLGSGSDAVDCQLASVPDPDSQTVHNELKCGKPGQNAAANSKDKVPNLNGTVAITSASEDETAINSPPAADPKTLAANTAPATADAVGTNTTNSPAPSNPTEPAVQTQTASPTSAPTTAVVTTPPTALASMPTTSSPLAASSPAPPPAAAPTNVAVPTAPLTNVIDSSALLTTTNRFGVTWQGAPVCSGKPSKRTAVQDLDGRLWWFEQNISCAYRKADGSSLLYEGYRPVQWESTPACKDHATLINSMADAQGRLWGWQADDNCKFVDVAGKPVKHDQLLATVIQLAASESDELKP